MDCFMHRFYIEFKRRSVQLGLFFVWNEEWAEIVKGCVRHRFSVFFEYHLASRRRALGWPLAVSQEEHLSYGIGSPFYAGRLGDFVA